MLLINFVREYQAIRSGGHEAVLDFNEGMPHVFQGSISTTPETRTTLSRAARVFQRSFEVRYSEGPATPIACANRSPLFRKDRPGIHGSDHRKSQILPKQQQSGHSP